ncbi:ABC transporter substrate-binding protein [Amycolatopsis umgeniensis]|uniref:Peptide/nickel transport system substrate-binding protein n=1 Tax=Amycolatopsis umgeniensis TaxID=336628 RepID=A0A841BGN3_9PSEU|nr:peptide ABC transporter substrate-binding protein [Amycolatopsis umgeniensis]MBB5857843.1 peptide/nickel transport system substrate-binding protein [Amycolatopsis umgeniensis]
MRKALAALAAALLACGGLSACGRAGSETADGGIYRLGSDQAIDSMNPFVSVVTTAFAVYEQIYPTLVQLDPNREFVAEFASDWTTSEDGRTWTFHTRPGATWSDGAPLTATDAAWTLNTIAEFKDGPTAGLANYVSDLDEASTPDPNTLVLRYSRPVANVLSRLMSVPILPEHVWREYADGDGEALTTFPNNAPVVSGGPFTLVRHVPKQVALFKRNPAYYGPKPHIAGFGIQFFSSDDAMITALKSRQIDAVRTVPSTSVANLKAAGFEVISSPGLRFDSITVNANPKQRPEHRELADPLVRQAFDHAINRAAIVETSLLGHGRPGASIIPPGTANWADRSLEPTPFDLGAANRLLDQAGHRKGPDGIRIANGHPMDYPVILPEDTYGGAGLRSFQIVRSDFAKIGVRLTAKLLDNAAANEAVMANESQDFAMTMWGWSGGTGDPDDTLNYLTCQSWGILNDTGYCSEEWDDLYARQGTAMTPAERHRIVDEMQRLAARDRVLLVLSYPDSIEAHSREWTDLPQVGGNSFSSESKIPLLSVRRAG